VKMATACLMVVVAAVVVAFLPQFAFSLMTAWSQGMSLLKIAVGAWQNPKTRGTIRKFGVGSR